LFVQKPAAVQIRTTYCPKTDEHNSKTNVKTPFPGI
jgi:hypothetical protein